MWIEIRTIIALLVAVLLLAAAQPARALISEPDVIFTGTVSAGGSLVTLTLNGAATPLRSFIVGTDRKYLLRVPMDAFGARVAGTARSGDTAVLAIDGVLAASYVIPSRGSVVKLELVKRSAEQWAADHPGDSGSGDMNRNGVSDLQEFLGGGDPAACVWAASDSSHAETRVYHPLVLQNCLVEAGRDLRHNLVRLATGSYGGNFSYLPQNGEVFDLTLIGGFDPAGGPERTANPALTLLSGDTDGDGTGNGVTLQIDTQSNNVGGRVRVEGLTVKNGSAPAGQKGGGIQALVSAGELELVGNIVSACRADSGGGISLEAGGSGSLFLANNLVHGNISASAAAIRVAASANGRITLINNTLAGNTATVAGNGRSLLIETATATVDLTNNIVTDASPVEGAEISIDSSGIAIPLTLSHNAYAGEGSLFVNAAGFTPDATVNGDPLFRDAAAADYRLSQGSPCIDSGFAHARLAATDIIATTRIVGSAPDLGAFEFTGLTSAGLTLANLDQPYDGTPKGVSVTTTPPGLKVDISYNGSPSPPTAVGSYAVVATINDLTYSGSASGTLMIGKGHQSIAFGTLAPRKLGNSDFAPGATASSGLQVSYSSSNPAVAMIVDNRVHLAGSGSAIITASQPGNASYLAAPAVSQVLEVSNDAAELVIKLSTLSSGATTASPLLNVCGTVQTPNGVRSLTVNGASVGVAPDGSFSYPVNLVKGANDINLIATDNSGLSSSISRTLYLDATAPGLEIDTPRDNSVVSSATAQLAGTVKDALVTVTYSVNGGNPGFAAMNDTAFSAIAALIPGMNTIEITASDPAGRTATAKRTVVYDPAFCLAVTSPATDIKSGSRSWLLKGEVSDNSVPVTVRIEMDGQTFTPALTDGAFEQQLTLDGEAVHPLIVTATDQNNRVVSIRRNITRVWFGDALGTSNGSGSVGLADALAALRALVNLSPVTPGLILRLDVAPPGTDGKPSGNGTFDIADALMILRRVVGLGAW